MVVERFKDLVSGMVRIVEGKVRAFAERPKHKDRSSFGQEFVDVVIGCLMRYDLDSQVEYNEYDPVDLIWSYLSVGMECKRLKKTQYVTKAWLKEHVVDRFREQEKLMKKPIRHRVLVVTEKKWDEPLDHYLAAKKVRTIVTGQIDSSVEELEASLVFMKQFEDLVSQICSGEVNDEWAG